MEPASSEQVSVMVDLEPVVVGSDATWLRLKPGAARRRKGGRGGGEVRWRKVDEGGGWGEG